MDLFETLAQATKPEPRKEQCRTCNHKIFVEYRSGKRFHYCSLQRNSRTHNGLLKVKCKTQACKSYEAKLKT
jgi:hypothetical protein